MISRQILAREALWAAAALVLVVPLWVWLLGPRGPAVTALPPHSQESLYERVERECLREFGSAGPAAVLSCQTRVLWWHIEQQPRDLLDSAYQRTR